jgi:hypothetical protein
VESARGIINPVFSMTEWSDGRLEVGGAGRGKRWSETDGRKLVKYGENGRRKGQIEYDRQLCRYRLPQLANVVSNGEGFGLSWGIGSSEAHAYRI